MWGAISWAVQQAISAAKSYLSKPKAAPAPAKPAPAPKPAANTVLHNPVTNWLSNNTPVGRAVSTAVNVAGRAVSGNSNYNWQAQARADAERVARERAEAEARALKERLRREKQAQLDNAKAGNSSALKKAADKYKGKWQKFFRADGKMLNGQNYDERTATPEMRLARQTWVNSFSVKDGGGSDGEMSDLFITTRDDYRKRTERLLAQMNNSKKGFLGSFQAQLNARKFAQQQQAALQNNIKKYEAQYKTVVSTKAKKESHLNWLANNGDQAEYERYYNETQNWLRVAARDLEYRRGATMGMADAYGAGMNKPLSGALGSAANVFDNVKRSTGDVLKETMKKIGQVVEVPNRAFVATAAKFGSPINKNDGSQLKVNGGSSWLDLYKQSENARGLNRKNIVVASKDKYLKELYNKLQVKKNGGKSYEQWYGGKKGQLDRYYESQKANAKNGDAVVNFLADPAMAIPASKIAKLPGLAGKGIKAAGAKTGVNPWISKLAETKVGKGVQWLGKEYKTPAQLFAEKAAPKWANVKNQADSIKRSFKVFKENQTRMAKVGKEAREVGTQQYYKLFKNKSENVIYLAQQLLRHKELGRPLPKGGFKVDVGGRLNRRTIDFGKMTKQEYREAIQLRDELGKLGGELYTKERGLGEQMKRWYKSRGMYNAETAKGLRYKAQKGYIAEKSYGGNKAPDEPPDFGIPFLKQQRKRTLQDPKRLSKSLSNRIYQHNRWINQYVNTPKFLNAMKGKSEKLGKTIDDVKLEREASVPSLTNVVKATAKGREWWGKMTPAQKTKYVASAAKGDLLGLPTNIWKAGVLALRPAWYVNNKAYNTFAGLQAGGSRYLLESAKMLKPGAKRLQEARRANPEVVSQIGPYSGGGKLYKAASAIEDHDRLAAFKAVKGNHPDWSDARALKEVDKWLLNYKTKNWERPLKTLMPFWAWTKGVTKANVRLQFEKPIAAKALNENNKNNEREANKIPEERRGAYKDRQYIGKDKDGNPKFMSTPFNPFNQSNFSVNPWLDAVGQMGSQKDFYGNPLEQKDWAQNLIDKFPQSALAKQLTAVMRGDKMNIKYFGHKGKDAAMTKERQGYDKSKPNYQSKLDPSHKHAQNWLAYMGMPRTTTFDKKRYEREERLTKLNDEFFSTDWDKKFGKDQYNEKVAAQQALAKKYGFDLEKDLYKGLWSKNDTDLTKDLKRQKEEARNYLADFWKEYHALPQDGNRNVWVKNKMKEVERSGILGKNAFIYDGLPNWFTPSSRDRAVSKEFWNRYFASDTATRRKLLAENPQYQKAPSAKKIAYDKAKASGNWTDYTRRFGGKTTSAKALAYQHASRTGDWSAYRKTYGDSPNYDKAKVEKALFWKQYYEADKETRKSLMAANPQYNKFKDQKPPTKDEWTVIMAAIKADGRSRAKGNSAFLAKYTEAMDANNLKAFKFKLATAPKAPKIKFK